MSADRITLPQAPTSSTCGGAPQDESKGLIVYVRDETESREVLEVFDRLDNPPDCCRLRTRQLAKDIPADHPQLVTDVAAHTGGWPLPLTVVDGNAVVARRLPTFDELVRFTSGKTLGHAPGLLPD
ncbi:hypothetical protein [Plantactinospora endophytica]|uniref:Uncharacterized protein n=1 Tax=Plantactinospora endophytica TaxID=673535 RepID=A0ABQ4E7K1_9ACTN|nr:hypothetical protein [Plantactinospora endophytica]GIG90650.1 hypothetical protein Pen02_55860 [Plantactinospora endophytica]